MRNLFDRKYLRYLVLLGGTNLKDYLGIVDDCLTIDVTKKGECTLCIIFRYVNNVKKPEFAILPREINSLIHSFCGDFIEVNLELKCPKFFPFTVPIWNVVDVKHNLYSNGNILLKHYYEYIAENTNFSNDELKNWTVTYGFEKEILRFYMRIKDFRLIEHYFQY